MKNDGMLPMTRIPAEDEAAMRTIAEKLNMKLSDVTRFALRRYLYGEYWPGAAPVDNGKLVKERAS